MRGDEWWIVGLINEHVYQANSARLLKLKKNNKMISQNILKLRKERVKNMQHKTLLS
jgi:hypothetical protein